MSALPHSGVLRPSGLPAPFPDVRGQLYRGGSRALQLHWQADPGGKCHAHVWAGRTLDWLPPPLLRYAAGVGEGFQRNTWLLGGGQLRGGVNQMEGREAELLDLHPIPPRQRARLSEVPTVLQPFVVQAQLHALRLWPSQEIAELMKMWFLRSPIARILSRRLLP